MERVTKLFNLGNIVMFTKDFTDDYDDTVEAGALGEIISTEYFGEYEVLFRDTPVDPLEVDFVFVPHGGASGIMEVVSAD